MSVSGNFRENKKLKAKPLGGEHLSHPRIGQRDSYEEGMVS
jgi:hypothetical protein